jgi:hypothetical protein
MRRGRPALAAGVAITAVLAHAWVGQALASRDLVQAVLREELGLLAVAAAWMGLRLLLILVLPGWLCYRIVAVLLWHRGTDGGQSHGSGRSAPAAGAQPQPP